MGTYCAPDTTVAPAAMRLMLARATALAIQDAAAFIGLEWDDERPADRSPEDVIATLWPEHDPLCECEASEEVVEAYEVARLEELDAIADDEDEEAA